jgi:hypothetical protein
MVEQPWLQSSEAYPLEGVDIKIVAPKVLTQNRDSSGSVALERGSRHVPYREVRHHSYLFSPGLASATCNLTMPCDAMAEAPLSQVLMA